MRKAIWPSANKSVGYIEDLRQHIGHRPAIEQYVKSIQK